MRQVLHLLVFLVVLGLPAACSETDIGSMDSEPAAPSPIVSLDGDRWEIDDPIGIFMVENGQQLSDGTIAEGAKNVLYSCSESNTSAYFNPVGSTIYYPQDGRPVDFIAYYPYISDISPGYLYPVNLLEQTSRHMDIMYSNNAEGLHKDSMTVNLKFSHVLSKLSFMLIPGEGSPDLSNAEIKVSNIDREAELKLVNGELINYGARGNSITIPDNPLFVLPR